MDQLAGALKVILPVLFMLAVGVICRKTGIIKSTESLKAIIVNVCLPAVLIKAFYQAEYSLRIVIVTLVMFSVCIAALGLGFGTKKLFNGKQKLLPFLTTGFEAGMLGYALYALLFSSVTPFAMVDLGQVLFVFTVYFTLLKKSEGGTLKSSLKSMITSPVIISIVTGVVLGATGLGNAIGNSSLGPAIKNILDFVSAPTAAIILVVVGFELEFKKSHITQSLAAVATRLVIMGALCAITLIGISQIIEVDMPLKWAFILMFMLPPPFVLPVFVHDDSESAFVSASLSISTLISLTAFAVISVIIA